MSEIIPRIDRKGNDRVTIVGRAVSNPKRSSRSVGSVIPRFAGRGGVSAGVVLSNSGIARGGLVRVTAYNPDKERRGIEDAARRKAAKEAEEKRKAAIIAESARRASVKIVSKVEEKPRYISGHGFRVEEREETETAQEGMMSQAERNLADLLEAAQKVKPKVDAVREADEPKSDEPKEGVAEVVGEEFPVEEKPEQKAAEIEEAEGKTADDEMREGETDEGAKVEEPKVEERGVIIPELPLVDSSTATEDRPRKKKGGRKGKRARAAMLSDEQE